MTLDEFGIRMRRGASGDVKVLCPRCSGDRQRHRHDRPLSVNIAEGVWNCHHCGWSGSLNRRDERQGAWRPTPLRPKPDVTAPLQGYAVEFLKGRGIDPVVAAEKYHIHGDDRAIHLPYYDGEEWVNTKHRRFNYADGAWDDKAGHSMDEGRPLIFWNLDACRGQSEIAITEGEWDAIIVNEAGIPAMSVPNGASKGSMKLDYLASAEDIIAEAKRILICVDTDEAGQRLESELVRRIGPEKCLRVTWSVGKDANDVFKSGGLELLLHDLQSPKYYPIEGLIRPIELADRLKLLYHEGAPRGFSTGMATIDPLFTIIPGMVYLVTGAPGAGKSEWLDQVVINTINMHDWQWAIFSPEGDPREEHLARMIEKLTHIPFFEGPNPRMDWATADAATTFIDDYVSFIDPEEPTVEVVLEAGRKELFRRGINALIIDPWNELIHENTGNVSDYLSKVLRDVRRWAARRGVAVFIVNQPHKLELEKDTKEYPLVRHYDLNGGAMWANKMSGIVSIWRSRTERERPVEVNVIKTKTRRIGRTGKALLNYDVVTGVFASPRAIEGETYEFLG